MARMKDVARAAGVSIYTVSAALSGSAPVSPELRARVKQAVEALGYERNSVARGLRQGRSSLIGLIVSDVTNPFFTELVDRIETEARQSGYSVLLGISGHDVARESELLRLMRSHQAAGTILGPAGAAADYRSGEWASGRMKLVAIDNAFPALGIDSIALDNRRAAALAVSHLLELGHRRIAMVGGLPHQHVARERLKGYRATLRQQGLSFVPALVESGNFRLDDGYAAGRMLMGLDPPPTALFVANNLMLIGVMRALGELGLRVPRDVSVCSVDDFPWAAAFQPTLTVVQQPIAAMAGAAFRALSARLEGEAGAPSHQLFAPQLLVRRSCAAPPAPKRRGRRAAAS
ncbi:LacI family DNA-binding transcriptional regulator [Aestuariivirga sp.]|uniref:LacI family DNA-binding transcriptional regulator n=1 Tax=Aestuariivirga sp. TaxID=2650926 RepID=UPI00391A2BA6